MTGEKIGRVARAAIPFFIIFTMAILIAIFPEVVMFLSDTVKLRG